VVSFGLPLPKPVNGYYSFAFVGVAFVLVITLFFSINQYCREPIFVFVFEGVLFVFAYASPAFALLFALPPKYTP
jgi:hypothetical protein